MPSAASPFGPRRGAIVGDALGVGPPWPYDLAEQQRDDGEGIEGYTAPKKERQYQAGRAAGW